MAILTGTTTSSVYRPRPYVAAPTPPVFDTGYQDTSLLDNESQWLDYQRQKAAYDDMLRQMRLSSRESTAFNVPSLSLSTGVRDLYTPYVPAVVPAEPTAPTDAAGGSYTSSYSGGMGPSAYGYRGMTGTKGTRGSAKYGFQPVMWNALQSAFSAMAEAGLGTPGITDGWRSYSTQVSLKKRKPGLASLPGRSVHGIGYAADLGLTKRQLAWLRKNGRRYGLIAPVKGESWHWQYDPSKIRRGDAGFGRGMFANMTTPEPKKYGLHPTLYDAISRANVDMSEKGLGTVGVTSGHRTPQEQTDLIKTGQTTARVGESLHTMTPSPAVDLNGTERQMKYLRDNAARYNLVPSSEPWHFAIDPRAVTR